MIINACKTVYPGVNITCCFFHLGQAVYRRIQTRGLSVRYNDKEDCSMKIFTHTMLSLAYVPVRDVRATYRFLRDECPDELLPIMDYFGETYVEGRALRGGRGTATARYIPSLWNQHDAALNKTAKTNNASEGWHHRFNLLVGKSHPDLFSLIKEFKKEQGYTEVCVLELNLGKRIRAMPKKKWSDLQDRIQGAVESYATHKANDTVLEYLRTLGHNIKL